MFQVIKILVLLLMAQTVQIDLVRGYAPYAKQVEFHRSNAKYRAFIGGVGSGKTEAGVAEAIKQAMLQPMSRGCAVAPTYTMLISTVIPVFRERLADELIAGGWSKGFKASTNDMRLRLVSGSEILFRSADKPDRLRGLNLAWFWIDEAALCDYRVWRVMIARLRQKGFNHLGWITTTPAGRNWVYKVFVEEATPQHAVIRATTYENPYLSEDFVADLEQSYDDKFFRQEVLAEFVSFEGLVYDTFNREYHVQRTYPDPSRLKRIVLGVDYGYSNPSAVLVVGIDEFEQVWVLDEWYKRRMTQPEVADAVVELAGRWGAVRAYVDPSAASLIEEIRRRHIAVEPANNDVMTGIAKIRNLLELRGDGVRPLKVTHNCVHTIAEFESYELERSSDGTYRDKPKKINDHAMDALRYAVMGLLGMPRIPVRYDGEKNPVRSDFVKGAW